MHDIIIIALVFIFSNMMKGLKKKGVLKCKKKSKKKKKGKKKKQQNKPRPTEYSSDIKKWNKKNHKLPPYRAKAVYCPWVRHAD